MGSWVGGLVGGGVGGVFVSGGWGAAWAGGLYWVLGEWCVGGVVEGCGAVGSLLLRCVTAGMVDVWQCFWH